MTSSYCLSRTALTGQDYWFGLYKYSAVRGASAYWLDGSNSTWRDWFPGEPNDYTYCVRFVDSLAILTLLIGL